MGQQKRQQTAHLERTAAGIVTLSKLSGTTTDSRGSTKDWIEQSLALVTPPALRIGYDRAAKLAQKALKENRTIREIVVKEGILTKDEADRILDPRTMLEPQA